MMEMMGNRGNRGVGRSARLAGIGGLALAVLALGGCASSGGGGEAQAQPRSEAAQQAAPPAGHPLAKIEKGMSQAEVRKIMGDPDDERSYLTGKMFIPFYFGSDAQRTEWIYNGQGRVAFSNGVYAVNPKVFRVDYDPSAGR